MNASIVSERLHTQQTYATTLTIENDPDFAHFSAKAIATDNVIHHRIIAVGSAEMNGQIASLEVGDTISVEGYLSELTQYQTYKKHEHVVANFHVDKIREITPSNSVLTSLTSGFRDTIKSGCSQLDKDERGVCEGLLIGERSNIDDSLYATYKQAQLTHLLVASGANIAFLVGFVSPLLSRLRVNTRSVALIVIAIFYCAATRFEPSIIRASVMVILPAVAMMRGYRLSQIKIFVGTLCACLLIDPFLMYRVGFWLSLAATAGLYFVSPLLIPKIRSTIISNTLSATFCVQPVLWLTFGFSAPFRWWASAIAVAIAEPLSTVGMVIIVLVSFLSPVSIYARLLISPMHLGCNWLNGVAELGASAFGLYAGVVFSAVGLIAYTYTHIRKRASREVSTGVNKRVLHYR